MDARQDERAASPPRLQREPQPRVSPGAKSPQSTTSWVDDNVLKQLDRDRLCRDVVIMLMSSDSIKQGLRIETLSLSGLEPDIAARLALRLVPHDGFAIAGRASPSDNQLQYVLWIWKHRRLPGCCASWHGTWRRGTGSLAA